MSTSKPSSAQTFATLCGLPNLVELPFPKPPSPPQTPDYRVSAAISEAQPPKPKGLFWELFGGHPDALAQDVTDHPDRYSSELVQLARELAERRKKIEELTPEEANLLNMGSLEFYQYRPPAPEKTKAPVLPPRPRLQQPIDPLASPAPGVDIPGEVTLRPYWWV